MKLLLFCVIYIQQNYLKRNEKCDCLSVRKISHKNFCVPLHGIENLIENLIWSAHIWPVTKAV